MKNNRKRYWFNLISFGLSIFILITLSAVILIAYNSTQAYLHPPRPREKKDTPAAYGVEFQDIRLVTRDGIELAAWYTPPKNSALILIGHGLADTKSPDLYSMFAHHGFGVLAWDFRAHGESGGERSTLGYYEALDVEAALDFSLEQDRIKHIGAWGGSMGGAAVLEAASRREEIEAVVVDSTYACLEDELKWLVNYDIFTPFIRFFAEWETKLDMAQLCPVDRIQQVSPRPVMIIHGEADDVIPVDASVKLFQAAGEPRFLWTEAGVVHVGMFSTFPIEYEDRVVGFFETYLLKTQ